MRRRHHEEHTNHEAWAIPYGDLITLLLAFFVVMYAVSSVNEGKYRVLADALHAEFRGQPTSMQPIQVGGNPGVSNGDNQIALAQSRALLETGETGANGGQGSSEDRPDGSKDPSIGEQAPPDGEVPPSESARNKKALDRVADQVEATMSNLIRENLVSVRRHELWVEVEIQTDILFASGSATLAPLAVSVLEPLADSLQPFKNNIRVEGHTDNVPISTVEFPSNWELSAARAASVVHLFSRRGVDPSRLTVIGYGEYRPVQSNATLDGRNANRRVVLVILGTGEAAPSKSEQQSKTAPIAPATTAAKS